MSVQIQQQFINQNRSYEGFSPQGVVVHSTATPGATAQAEHNYFNNGDRGASAHAFVDWTGCIQCIPWNEKAWHAMSYANNRFIGVECCEPSGHNVAQFNSVYDNAVDVFAQLFINVLHQKIVTKDNLLSHNEVSNRWHQSDHNDPVAFFGSYGKTVDQFRIDVQTRINVYTHSNENVLPDIVYIENPKNGFSTSGVFELNGWALSSANKIELILNGKSCGTQQLQVNRPDVLKVYPKYKKSKVGFKWGINIADLQFGENILTVWSGNANQTIKVIRTNPTPDKVYIDSPKTGFTTNSTFELNGWALSSANEIELILNGNSCGRQKLSILREDVYKAYPQYNKHNVGFKWGININDLKMGENILTVWSGNANQTIKVIRK